MFFHCKRNFEKRVRELVNAMNRANNPAEAIILYYMDDGSIVDQVGMLKSKASTITAHTYYLVKNKTRGRS